MLFIRSTRPLKNERPAYASRVIKPPPSATRPPLQLDATELSGSREALVPCCSLANYRVPPERPVSHPALMRSCCSLAPGIASMLHDAVSDRTSLSPAQPSASS